MAKKWIIVIGIVFMVPLQAKYDYRYNTAGQWEILETNWGSIGGWGSPWLGYWPRSSGHNYIFGSGMWIGGILPNGDTIVSVGYNPRDRGSEFSAGLPYTDPMDTMWHIYYSTDDNYPYLPRTMEDGYTIYNDFDTLRHMPDSFHVPAPLGIRVSQYTYVWARDWADDVVFIKYIIKNDTTYTINNAYMGFCMDFDIGNESGTSCNDRCGCDLTRRMFYGWQEAQEPGWSDRGMIGLKLLSTTQPLSAFKRFTLNFEPRWDWQRYLTLAGYNYNNGNYEPYDTIWPPPDDQRFLIATGPYNLLPGDSVILDWALLAGHDTIPPSPDLYMKADRAQRYYDIDTVHRVAVTHPMNEEIISGLYRIGYTTVPATGYPLKADAYFKSENYRDTVAFGIDHVGSFEWFTDSVPDCVLGKISVLVFDTVTFGYGKSNGYFTIDNPGNSPPFLRVISPCSPDTIAGVDTVKWYARDPEFHDSLPISIFFRNQYDTAFTPLVIDHLNDSIFPWNTKPHRNGLGWLIVETHDQAFSDAETIQVYLRNNISGGGLEHLSGLNNVVNLTVLIHQPENLTGHTYELRFKPYGMFGDSSMYYTYPEYSYDLIDSNTGTVIMNDYSIRGGYTLNGYQAAIDDYSPIIDGFSIRSWTWGDTVVWKEQYQNDSVRVVNGVYPEDSIRFFENFLKCWWAYRGSRISLDWALKPGGGLTMCVFDLDYGDTIPYKPYNNMYNNDSAFGWCFNPNQSIYNPSDTLRAGDRYIFLCGNRLFFSRIIPAPVPGDRWIVYPNYISPPIEGNVYRFHPINDIMEKNTGLKSISMQIYPVPAVRNINIDYSLGRSQQVNIVIYDILGRKIKELINSVESSGMHRLRWDCKDDHSRRISAGVYFCRYETDQELMIRKFVLTR